MTTMNSVHQHSGEKRDGSSDNNTSGGQTLSVSATHGKYRTPNHTIDQHGNLDKLRRLSPEDLEQQRKIEGNMSRLEYSPIIFDDTDNDSVNKRQRLTLDHSALDHKSTSHMDTSRFGDNILLGFHQPHLQTTYRSSNISNLSYFIDPKEHVKTLKSPIRDRLARIINERCSRSPSQEEKSQPQNKRLVKQLSPVHFGDPIKFDHLNNSKILDNMPILGKSHRPKSIRVLRVDCKTNLINAPPLRLMMLNQSRTNEDQRAP